MILMNQSKIHCGSNPEPFSGHLDRWVVVFSKGSGWEKTFSEPSETAPSYVIALDQHEVTGAIGLIVEAPLDANQAMLPRLSELSHVVCTRHT